MQDHRHEGDDDGAEDGVPEELLDVAPPPLDVADEPAPAEVPAKLVASTGMEARDRTQTSAIRIMWNS